MNFDAAGGYRWYHGQKNEYDDKMKWMMIADDNGKQQLAILNGPKSTRPLALADDVRFYLYTKYVILHFRISHWTIDKQLEIRRKRNQGFFFFNFSFLKPGITTASYL